MPGNAALVVNETRDARQRLDVIVAPDTEVLRADPALGHNRRRFSLRTSAAPPTARLPRWTRCQSLANPSLLGLLAHRRDHDAVAKKHVAHSQRREQVSVLICKHAKESHRMRNSFLLANRSLGAVCHFNECGTERSDVDRFDEVAPEAGRDAFLQIGVHSETAERDAA